MIDLTTFYRRIDDLVADATAGDCSGTVSHLACHAQRRLRNMGTQTLPELKDDLCSVRYCLRRCTFELEYRVMRVLEDALVSEIEHRKK